MPTTPPEVPARDYRGCGRTTPVALRERLAAAITQYGLPNLAKTVGVDQRTLLRAVAGAGVRHASLFLIQARLDEIEAAQASTTAESAPPPPSNGGTP